jgi:2-keto-3-deoxy-L-rhamnonate aldolase RhmA
VAKAAAKQKMHWAILPLSPDHARRCVSLGCRMLAAGMDTWAVQRGLRSYLTDYGIGDAK